ncbi:sulfite exporter TauE/SafE family protein [Ammoniphilus sp. CFH 90114]|uniref:sulfite exporter TauE/SafE family protein n=1 Tax=Ammoniphilus sp. CFH 90114 TaxID=2493665 RepID=UPI00100DBF21|nr:sulfite exporter TauE/SafE family protein [Ammoniphilus sp. CFH 90114]RXT14662.1 sulfite exporter TauE/SafE family protein [Ammoniphilus sp. CFH 90114]
MNESFYLFAILGLLMGVLSGLGLGGGKLLIPALVLFTSIGQAEAQGATLLSFVPISIVAILTHMKERNIDWSLVGWVVIGAIGGSLLGSMMAMGPLLPYLRIVFGIFLIGLGIFELLVKDRVKKKMNRTQTT